MISNNSSDNFSLNKNVLFLYSEFYTIVHLCTSTIYYAQVPLTTNVFKFFSSDEPSSLPIQLCNCNLKNYIHGGNWRRGYEENSLKKKIIFIFLKISSSYTFVQTTYFHEVKLTIKSSSHSLWICVHIRLS